ncbi:hypothetical protein FKM82_021474 [Ascaphus truei]
MELGPASHLRHSRGVLTRCSCTAPQLRGNNYIDVHLSPVPSPGPRGGRASTPSLNLIASVLLFSSCFLSHSLLSIDHCTLPSHVPCFALPVLLSS